MLTLSSSRHSLSGAKTVLRESLNFLFFFNHNESGAAQEARSDCPTDEALPEAESFDSSVISSVN